MQISKETLEVLHNFASINPNIMISPGQQLKTIAEAKNIMAQSEIVDDFPAEFGIYDLNEFLSVINLIDQGSLSFEEGYVTISNGNASIKYFYSDPDILTTPTKEINMPDPEFSVNITDDQMGQIRKAAAVLGHAELVITNKDKGQIYAEVQDVNDPTSNNFYLLIDSDNACTNEFNFVFSIPNLKLLPGDYYVNISSKLISHWTNSDFPVNYYIALEKGSDYNV